jgi:hypothetical protein
VAATKDEATGNYCYQEAKFPGWPGRFPCSRLYLETPYPILYLVHQVRSHQGLKKSWNGTTLARYWPGGDNIHLCYV